ncbi:10657_t:CDS:2 [Funneliformis geosporum]|uniref:2694_t:CDS:1 n=1 Tax=Funneliformis geosporum TaxID=1117311 RepID=A0A9W4SLW8_9GLOM|nr:2694_t:CDS:2 [Funneliformis geosporum]CAI2175717.1 10657_t:CDS:2 [Funneliformis geosporum]
MIPSPHSSPQVNPNIQPGLSLPPPFGTPPVSPFSNPRNNVEYLTPPLNLPPMMSSIPKQQGPTTSVFSVPMTPSNANTAGNGEKPLTTADQRELARKVSHSAIERRRREKINDKIMQLKELIPSCADQDHLHKLSILQSAIEYIQYLQGCVVESRKREGNNGRNSEGRTTKRSKFDRYEIPIPKSIEATDNLKNKDGSSNVSKSDNSKNREEGSVNHEGANALLLLSISHSTTTNPDSDNDDDIEDKRIPVSRRVEVQTSPNLKETIEDEDEHEESTPSRSAMTVQQLLC